MVNVEGRRDCWKAVSFVAQVPHKTKSDDAGQNKRAGKGMRVWRQEAAVKAASLLERHVWGYKTVEETPVVVVWRIAVICVTRGC